MRMRQLKISNTVTSRESISLNKYLQEIGKLKTIDAEEEAVLCRKIQQGDQKALEKLVKANLRFVVSVAKQYQGNSIPLPDLVNEGNIGLVKAAKKFDETRGFKFISFAVWWIRQEIIQSIAQQAQVIRLPLNKTVLLGKIRKASSILEQQLCRQPSPWELSEKLNIPLEDIEDALDIGTRPVSLDAPVGEEEDAGTMADIIENREVNPTDEAMNHGDSLRTEISRRLKMLTDREKETICSFFGIGEKPMSLDDIARKLDLTTERVRQIKEKALEKLKASCNFQALRDFL